jgi:ribosomal protein L37AE/L43A
MGDMGDVFRAIRERKKEQRQKLAVDCPRCREIQPKRTPTKLMPGQKCKVDGYRDPREQEKRDAD